MLTWTASSARRAALRAGSGCIGRRGIGIRPSNPNRILARRRRFGPGRGPYRRACTASPARRVHAGSSSPNRTSSQRQTIVSRFARAQQTPERSANVSREAAALPPQACARRAIGSSGIGDCRPRHAPRSRPRRATARRRRFPLARRRKTRRRRSSPGVRRRAQRRRETTQPTSRASSTFGTSPNAAHRTSHAISRILRPSVTTADRTLELPVAAVIHVPVAYGVVMNADRSLAAWTSIDGLRQSDAAKPTTRRAGACSATSTRLAPASLSAAATGSSSGPEPAITTRSPRNDIPLLSSACAPPIPKTLGSVQPGNGRNRSRAPVARIRRRASIGSEPVLRFAVTANPLAPNG